MLSPSITSAATVGTGSQPAGPAQATGGIERRLGGYGQRQVQEWVEAVRLVVAR
jgi:hypothetical protein